jgi:hypothetical protein
MATLWGKLTSKYAYYASDDPIIKKSTLEYYQLLKHVYQMRATTDTKVYSAIVQPGRPAHFVTCAFALSSHRQYGPRLTVSSFLSILRDASMIEAEQETLCVGCFLDAQLAPPAAWELEDLVLCEFMEALARVAIKTIEPHRGSTFTDGKRVRMAFNFVAELNDAGAGRGGGGHK